MKKNTKSAASKPTTKKTPVAKKVSAVKKTSDKVVPVVTQTKAKASSPQATSVIAAWDHDPGAGGKVSHRPIPKPDAGILPFKITTAAPKAGLHPEGSADFRYWCCADALQRTREIWKPHLAEDLKWKGAEVLDVHLLDDAQDLTACYDRQSLSFFQATVKGVTVHTAESPDVVAHEVGHAILDAMRPDLWDVALDEVAAFHESFADITALLTALHVPTVAESLLKETGGLLYQSSRVSRFAVQFGRAVHEQNPTSAPPDCLRNAVNSFFYREPLHLPPVAPYTELSSEPHSFSRLFTGAFFEAMAGMLKLTADNPSTDDLLQVAKDAVTLLAKAVKSSAVSAAFFSEVAAHVIWADAALFGGKYDEALRSAFVRKGLLSLEAVRSLRAEAQRVFNPSKPHSGGDEMPRGRDMILRASAYGLAEGALVVRTASFSRRGAIAPAAPEAGSTPVPGVEQATQTFLETLFRRGRVDFSQCKPGISSVSHRLIKRKTHYLIEQNGQLHLRRRCFDEGQEW